MMPITPPNYTQTPNELFDHWLPLLGEAELKVLLVIMRKTFGWHKKRDIIAISQLAKLTGLLEETVVKATKCLQQKGLILREVMGVKGNQYTEYSLVVEENSNNNDTSVKPRGHLGLTTHDQTEAQKKASFPKETAAKEKETAAASFDPAKQTKPKVYQCLESIDIPLLDKMELTRNYSVTKVIQGIEWGLSQKSFTKGLAAAIKYSCKHDLKYEAPKAKQTPYETISRFFSHGVVYNGAECHLKTEAVGFTRGMKNEDVKFDKYFTWEKFNKMCASFGIKTPTQEHK